jgi:hypothetical protein
MLSGYDLRSVASSVAPSDSFVSDIKSSSAIASSLESFETLSLVERTESACTLASTTSDCGSILQQHADGFIRITSGLYLHGGSAELQEQGFVKEGPNTLHEFKLLGLSLTVDALGDWVVAHVAQTRAAAAGASQAVHPGEICVLVDEWDIKGASPEQVRELLDGPVGSNVLLTVKSKSGQTRHVEMTRGKKPRKQPPNSLFPHTATRAMKHEDVGHHEAAYSADSYGQSSNLRNHYASDAEEEPAAEKTGAVPGARSDALKPRELHTSLDLKGTLQHAANLYHTSRVSPSDPPQSAGQGGVGGGVGGGVVEEPLVQVKKQKASAEPEFDQARSEPFAPTPSTGSSGSRSLALPAPTAAMSSGMSRASSVAPSERFGPVSSSGAVASFFGASRTNSAAPNRLQPVTAFGVLAAGEETSLHGTASGLIWQCIGATKPPKGQELRHAQLCKELYAKSEFTAQEWEAFGITDLGMDHFVKSGAYYFAPAATITSLLRRGSSESAYDLNMSAFASAATFIASAELRPTESARAAHNSAPNSPARVDTQLSPTASVAEIRALELKARFKEQESLELTMRVSRLQAELQEHQELETKAARKYLQQQAILDQHRHREEQLLRRRHDESAGRQRAEAAHYSIKSTLYSDFIQ